MADQECRARRGAALADRQRTIVRGGGSPRYIYDIWVYEPARDAMTRLTRGGIRARNRQHAFEYERPVARLERELIRRTLRVSMTTITQSSLEGFQSVE